MKLTLTLWLSKKTERQVEKRTVTHSLLYCSSSLRSAYTHTHIQKCTCTLQVSFTVVNASYCSLLRSPCRLLGLTVGAGLASAPMQHNKASLLSLLTLLRWQMTVTATSQLFLFVVNNKLMLCLSQHNIMSVINSADTNDSPAQSTQKLSSSLNFMLLN